MTHWFEEAVIQIKSGNGGKGCESFHYRTDHKREPNGGNGGSGGSVWIEADPNISGLLGFKYNQHFFAEDGHPGQGNQKAGRSGRDIVIRVPCGTTVFNAENGLRIRDLTQPGDRVLAAKGGRGGAGNHTQRPARPGAGGAAMSLRLDLRLVADIFLVGTPGAGKSLLLHRLTHARLPETARPFATQVPQIGVCREDEEEEVPRLVICELPSLIRGSREGRGLGNRFLKHLDRARMIFFVMEPESPFAGSLAEAFEILREEVGAGNQDFLNRPFFCIINKMDTMAGIASRKALRELKKETRRWKAPVHFISALNGEGIPKLMKDARKRIKP